MEKKYSIGLTIFLILFLGVLMYADRAGYEYKKEKIAQEAEENKVITTQGNADKKEIYYLTELNGYVVVFKEDKNSLFEYTNILVEDLPEELQKEIRNWKRMDGLKSVYGFLENYSS